MYQRIDSFKPKEIYLLTKYFCDTNFDNCPDFKGKRRWREVYELLNKYKSKDLVEAFLVKEIVGFMEVKNMATPKVSYELMKGMEALRSLLSQIEIALEGIPYKKSFGYEWMVIGWFHEDKKLGGSELTPMATN